MINISCQLSPDETIGMECQLLFWRKIKKNIVSVLPVEFASSVLSST